VHWNPALQLRSWITPWQVPASMHELRLSQSWSPLQHSPAPQQNPLLQYWLAHWMLALQACPLARSRSQRPSLQCASASHSLSRLQLARQAGACWLGPPAQCASAYASQRNATVWPVQALSSERVCDSQIEAIHLPTTWEPWQCCASSQLGAAPYC
jgi:hypothetical protein